MDVTCVGNLKRSWILLGAIYGSLLCQAALPPPSVNADTTPGLSASTLKEPEAQTGLPIFITVPRLFEPLKRAPVMFRHDQHTEALNDEDCSVCHPKKNGKFKFSFPKDRNERSATTLMDSYHDACVGCHTRRSAEHKKTGPVNCGECHDDRKAYHPARYLPTLPDSYGTLRNPYHGDCMACHRKPEKTANDAEHLNWKRFYVQGKSRVEVEWPRVVFDYYIHDKHAKALQMNCKPCHSPDLKPKFASKRIELSAKHQLGETSKSCAKCHSYAGGIPNAKCESCHPLIKERRFMGSGYHGTFKEDCVHCHKEHLEPSQSIVPLEPKKFDHNLSNYRLEGKHVGLECAQCHLKKRTATTPGSYYLGLPYGLCTDCHRDPHNRQFVAACSTCHSPSGWKGKDLMFTHATNSTYPLLDKHATVECAKCHKPKWPWSPLASATFKGLTTDCAGCHTDPHRGQFKQACAKCHPAPTTWKLSALQFNHDKDSAYALSGKHAAVDCLKCHKPRAPATQLGSAVFKGLATGCETCHPVQHPKSYGSLCVSCHTTAFWTRKQKVFNHKEVSKFELVGKHLSTPCVKCHNVSMMGPLGQPGGTSYTCYTCHKKDDAHKGTLGPICSKCHTTAGWKGKDLIFDHNTMASYPLKLYHEKVSCVKCHANGRWKPVNASCDSCHPEGGKKP